MAPPRSSAPPYTYNVEAARYVDPRTGRFVPRQRVHDALNAALDATNARMRTASTQLRAGTISLAEWQQTMRAGIKDVHLYSAATARGGWAQMSFTDYGNLGPEIRFHYGKLDAFAAQLASGQQPLDGRFLQRVDLYLQAGRNSYWAQDAKVHTERGLTEERNVLRPADHCSGCIAETRRGWVPMGTLRPIGRRTCLSRCRCMLEYR